MSIIEQARTFLLQAEKSVPADYAKPQQIDHLCYRAQTISSYKEVCQKLGNLSLLLSESQVNGRPISCYFLPQGLKGKDNLVHLIEVTSPKASSQYKEGFEHIKILSKHPQNDILLHGFKIKFCQKPLLRLIQDERWQALQQQLTGTSQSIFNLCKNKGSLLAAVNDSRVLSILSDYNPKICGTYPVGIAIENSDIDIVCSFPSIHDAFKILQKHFQKYAAFKIKRASDHIVCQFRHRDILFEIYGSPVATEKHSAYVHMLTEGKLLSYTGEWARQHIISLKKSGLKTEPAFADFYQISGDPYEMLYSLYERDEELRLLSYLCLTKR